MKIDILTLFPDMFEGVLSAGVIGRAAEKGLLEFRVADIRDHSEDKHRGVDDYPFGGGAGQLMTAQPIFSALKSLGVEPRNNGKSMNTKEPPLCVLYECGEAIQSENKPRMIYLSPRGRLLDKKLAEELSKEQALVLLCGHYEGVDQRVLDAFDFEEVSIGDYILTGGELPAMVLIDTVCRLVPGVLGSEESHSEESIYSGLLEYPQYTRPASYEGMDVPETLISGDHAKIALWNFEEALKLTAERRPDLLRDWMVSNFEKLDKKRKKIASLYYETIHVVGAVIVKDKKVLATQRGYGNYAGWWEFPGGKIEEGEDPKAALRRELKEELASDIQVGDFFCKVEYSYPEFHVSLSCFLCELKRGDISLLEHSRAVWLGHEDVYSVKWLGADLPVIEKLIREEIIG